MNGWWLNHFGQPVHTPCGAVGVDLAHGDTITEEIHDGLHWLRCRTCDNRIVIPPRREPLWRQQYTYGGTAA